MSSEQRERSVAGIAEDRSREEKVGVEIARGGHRQGGGMKSVAIRAVEGLGGRDDERKEGELT